VPGALTSCADEIDTWSWRNGRLFRSSWPFRWADGETVEDAVQHAGFSTDAALRLGDPGDHVEIVVYERVTNRDEIPQRVADVTISNYGFPVFIDSLEEYLDFLAHLAPMVAAVATLSDRTEAFEDKMYEAKLARQGRR